MIWKIPNTFQTITIFYNITATPYTSLSKPASASPSSPSFWPSMDLPSPQKQPAGDRNLAPHWQLPQVLGGFVWMHTVYYGILYADMIVYVYTYIIIYYNVVVICYCWMWCNVEVDDTGGAKNGLPPPRAALGDEPKSPPWFQWDSPRWHCGSNRRDRPPCIPSSAKRR